MDAFVLFGCDAPDINELHLYQSAKPSWAGTGKLYCIREQQATCPLGCHCTPK